jgi:hypothetical protein
MIQSLSHLKHGEFYFPMLDGTSGQVLVTDGNGQLTWQTQQTGTNKFLSALSFNTSNGILTATVSGSSNVTVDLDGRYSLSSHNHNSLYDNYKSWNLKTNGTQRTTVQSGGTLDLKAGSNVTLSYGAGGVVTIASTDTNTNNYADSLSFNTGNGILTLGRSGTLSDLTVDLDGRYSTTDTNNYISSVSFNTGNGILTLNRSGLSSLTVDLDGKYLTKTWKGGDDYFAGHHAEGRLLANAYLANDLANTRRRGSTFNLTNTSLSDTEIDRMFDGLSTFAGVPKADFANGPVVIEFDIPRKLTYGAYVGIGFGNAAWRCKDVHIEAYSQGNWVTCIHETNNSYEDVYTNIPGNSGVGTTAFRITLDNPNADVRICHIWAYNYNSDLWSQAIMPRSGGRMYGDLSLDGTLTASGYNNSNWDKAYGWGNHAGLYLGATAKAADSNLLDGIDSTAFLRSNISDTFTGALTIDGYIKGNGQQLILSAGESHSYATGQTNEYIYLNAEQGLEINSDIGNWSGGWAARKTAYLRGDQLTLDGETLSKTNIQNFKTAYGWGDHSTEGYIKDGNSGWNNSYGFITASSTDKLTNKSGNISQWTNDVGYITSYTDTNTQLSDADIAAMGYIKDGNTNWNNTYGFVTSSGNTIIGTDSDINTSGATIIDNLYMTDGVITSHGTRVLTAADLGITAPKQPAIDKLTIVGETIEILFSKNDTNINSYQLWSSVNGGSYSMVGVIPQDEITTTMTFIDDTFNESGNVDYKLFAIRNGMYSVAGVDSISFSKPSLSVVNMSVVPLNESYFIQFDLPQSRFVDHIEIYGHSTASSGSLQRGSASLVYSGNNTTYMYQAGKTSNFNQFWVEVIAS